MNVPLSERDQYRFDRNEAHKWETWQEFFERNYPDLRVRRLADHISDKVERSLLPDCDFESIDRFLSQGKAYPRGHGKHRRAWQHLLWDVFDELESNPGVGMLRVTINRRELIRHLDQLKIEHDLNKVPAIDGEARLPVQDFLHLRQQIYDALELTPAEPSLWKGLHQDYLPVHQRRVNRKPSPEIQEGFSPWRAAFERKFSGASWGIFMRFFFNKAVERGICPYDDFTSFRQAEHQKIHKCFTESMNALFALILRDYEPFGTGLKLGEMPINLHALLRFEDQMPCSVHHFLREDDPNYNKNSLRGIFQKARRTGRHSAAIHENAFEAIKDGISSMLGLDEMYDVAQPLLTSPWKSMV